MCRASLGLYAALIVFASVATLRSGKCSIDERPNLGIDSQAVPPGAATPQPADGAQRIDPSTVVLRWAPVANAISHRLFFGPADPPVFREEMTRVRYEPGPLASGTAYFWRIDELTASGIIVGRTWRFTTAGMAGQVTVPAVSWAQCMDQPEGWYATPEAVRIAEDVLLYQRRTGGWPKNIDMAVPLSPDGRQRLAEEKPQTDSTLDNGATTTQIRFLARVSAASKQERFRPVITSGLRYLLEAQYPNGGWPQYYPLRNDYSRQITFNDDAMVHVLELLKEVAQARPPFSFIDQPMQAGAAKAVDRGVQLILKAQIRVKGKLTAWCAQHDAVTLEPCKARAYELPSLSGRESVSIILFLMAIERPTAEVVRAIEAAVEWFRSVAIKGSRLVRKSDPETPRGFDYELIADPSAPSIWARFYEIATNRPMYVGRDGVIKDRLADIEYERRTGYTYLGPFASDLLNKDYPAWKKRLAAGAVSTPYITVRRRE